MFTYGDIGKTLIHGLHGTAQNGVTMIFYLTSRNQKIRKVDSGIVVRIVFTNFGLLISVSENVDLFHCRLLYILASVIRILL